MIGTFVLMFSVVSIVAYGGYYVGIAAGCAGGILALLFRPPRYRELTQWSNRPTGRIGGGTEEFAGKHRTPTSFGTAAVVPEKGETASLSSDAYAPPPPPRRAYPPPALGPPVSASPSAARTVPDSALPRYGNLSDALTGRPASAAARSAPRPVISPPPPPHPAARPTVSAASAAWVPPSRPSSVPARSAAAAAPVPPSSASGSPVVLPRSAAAPDGVATGPVTQQRSWKCPKCGLTNAPWSANCTRCQTPVPRM